MKVEQKVTSLILRSFKKNGVLQQSGCVGSLPGGPTTAITGEMDYASVGQTT